MAKRKPSNASSTAVVPADQQTQQLERIARLLALLAVKGENQTDKIVTLTAAGFAPAEVAQLLGTTPNSVSVTVYKAAKEKSKRGPRTRKL